MRVCNIQSIRTGVLNVVNNSYCDNDHVKNSPIRQTGNSLCADHHLGGGGGSCLEMRNK